MLLLLSRACGNLFRRSDIAPVTLPGRALPDAGRGGVVTGVAPASTLDPLALAVCGGRESTTQEPRALHVIGA